MIDQFFNSVIPFIKHFHLIGYWIAFFAALLETTLIIGMFLPGSTLLLIIGAFSATGNLDISMVLGFAIVGAIFGDNLNYWLGRRYGHRWVVTGVWFLKPEYFDKARTFFNTHGARSVFLGRFIPSIKEITPFVAGLVGMHRRTFVFWNILGGIGWGFQWVGAGYLFGQSLALAQTWMTRAGMVLLVVIIIAVSLWVIKRSIYKHGHQFWLMMVSLYRSVHTAVLNNPYIRQYRLRHPKVIIFLSERMDRSQFKGLSLTLLSLTFFYILALFAGAVEDVVTSDTIVSIDHTIAQLFSTFRTQDITSIFVWITSLGRAQVILLMLSLTAISLYISKRTWLIFPLIVSSGCSTAFTWLGKMAFHRARPEEAILLETSYSFPSGHATISVAFYGFITYILIRSIGSFKVQINLLFAGLILVGLIGVSRIVLAEHYISDVWAGYLVGSLWLIVGISISEWLTSIGRIKWDNPIQTSTYWIVLGNTLVAICLYIWLTLIWQPVRSITPVAKQVDLTTPITQYLSTHHISFTKTLIGENEQPIGFAIAVNSPESLISILRKAGWNVADETNTTNLVHLYKKGMKYTTAPLAPTFWNGHINDFALEKTNKDRVKTTISTIRIWRTPYKINHQNIFLGIARDYNGLRWGIVHQVSPDIDSSTEYFLETLKSARLVKASCDVMFEKPVIGEYLLGNEFFTSGKLVLIDLDNEARHSVFCVK